MRATSYVLSISLITMTACGGVCTTELVPGIRVLIDEDLTNVTVTATEGSFTETVTVAPGAALALLVHERPGTYRVEVRAPGHESWVATAVRVEEDDCHVETVELTADLVPNGG